MISQAIPFAVAIGSVGMFYAHTLFRTPQTELTPAITFGITLALGVSCMLGALSGDIVSTRSYLRKYSTLFLFLSISLQLISCLSGYLHKNASNYDWGTFAVQVLTPIFLAFSTQRGKILVWTLRLSVLFALIDFTFNFLTYTGLSIVSRKAGEQSYYGIHYLGLAGNSLAEGLIAFLAVSYIASGISYSRTALESSFKLLLIGVLFLSEVLIGSRTYIGISITSAILLSLPNQTRVSLSLLSISVSGLLLFATFYHSPYDINDDLRAKLVERGSVAAGHHILLGEGARYRATADLAGNFRSLSNAGVTESGTIDYTIEYGLFSTVTLYISFFMALGQGRPYRTISSVLLCCQSGALAINGGISSFLGEIVLYTSLIICQKDEEI